MHGDVPLQSVLPCGLGKSALSIGPYRASPIATELPACMHACMRTERSQWWITLNPRHIGTRCHLVRYITHEPRAQIRVFQLMATGDEWAIRYATVATPPWCRSKSNVKSFCGWRSPLRFNGARKIVFTSHNTRIHAAVPLGVQCSAMFHLLVSSLPIHSWRKHMNYEMFPHAGGFLKIKLNATFQNPDELVVLLCNSLWLRLRYKQQL